ncbi:MAG: beta-aspartyl-peptidase [Oscillospiraceae bacterium]|nr:beta-aspartyl-peptidase [Oscillospiraceae bacterium]
MLTLLKNLECYCPEYIGKNDILICGSKIYKIEPKIECYDDGLINRIYDFSGYFAFPGLVDQHLHFIGGGGEQGFASRIPEIEVGEIVKTGISTAVGVLGADGVSKTLESLYAKAKGLQLQGLTTYIYGGSYSMPPVTITGDVTRDFVFIDKVIGIKTALSDFRSSNAGDDQLIKIASKALLGGMVSGKAGIVHIHMGDGKKGLSTLLEVLENTDLPINQFVVTHMNRSNNLFFQAKNFLKLGGNIDFTAGEVEGVSVPDAISSLLGEGIDMSNVTISSDGNAGLPNGGTSCVGALYEDIKSCIVNKGIRPEISFCPATKNAAKALKLYPRKGTLKMGSDADILVTDSSFNIVKLFCMGNISFERI